MVELSFFPGASDAVRSWSPGCFSLAPGGRTRCDSACVCFKEGALGGYCGLAVPGVTSLDEPKVGVRDRDAGARTRTRLGAVEEEAEAEAEARLMKLALLMTASSRLVCGVTDAADERDKEGGTVRGARCRERFEFAGVEGGKRLRDSRRSFVAVEVEGEADDVEAGTRREDERDANDPPPCRPSKKRIEDLLRKVAQVEVEAGVRVKLLLLLLLLLLPLLSVLLAGDGWDGEAEMEGACWLARRKLFCARAWAAADGNGLI